MSRPNWPTRPCWGAFRELLAEGLEGTRRTGRCWTVPVAYGAPFGEDLEHVAATLRLDPDEVIAAHASTEYLVYLVGFNPGAPNLGKVVIDSWAMFSVTVRRAHS